MPVVLFCDHEHAPFVGGSFEVGIPDGLILLRLCGARFYPFRQRCGGDVVEVVEVRAHHAIDITHRLVTFSLEQSVPLRRGAVGHGFEHAPQRRAIGQGPLHEAALRPVKRGRLDTFVTPIGESEGVMVVDAHVFEVIPPGIHGVGDCAPVHFG